MVNDLINNYLLLIHKQKRLLLVIILSLLLFSPALFTFFSGDDWFHLRVVQISSFQEFLNFFNPVPNEQSTAFYRPIPNQLFFFIFYTLFGLKAFFYHLFVFTLFAVSLYLFFILLKRLKMPENSALLSTVIIAFSHTNFSRLYFLSAAQEIIMSVFVLLAMIVSINQKLKHRYIWTALFFLLALLSKDSAIVLPVLVLMVDWLNNRRIDIKKMSVLATVAFVYLVIRVFVFGFTSTMDANDSYAFIFSPRPTINTLYMYTTWAIGGAELLQDYLSSPIQLIDRFYSDFGVAGKAMIAMLITNWLLLGFLIIKKIRKINRFHISAIAVFIISLLPVLFLPNYKFAIQMSLSMFGFAAFVGLLLAKESKTIKWLFIGCYLSLNLLSVWLTQNSHYSVMRAQISERVYSYFLSEHPSLPKGSVILIKNAQTIGSNIETWGSSKQVSYAIMGDNLFKVLYGDNVSEVHYEDFSLPDLDIVEGPILYVSAEKFLP